MFEQIVYENKQITAITVKREYDFSEVLSVLKTFFGNNNTQHLLLDLRYCSFDTMTHDHIRDLCEYTTLRADGENRVNGKTALVGSNDLQLEICKIIKLHSEMIDSAIKVSVFPSTEEALSWLEEG
jgi:hypothetical protein